MNEYKYTEEQLNRGANVLIDRAIRDKSALGQTLDVMGEFESSRISNR